MYFSNLCVHFLWENDEAGAVEEQELWAALFDDEQHHTFDWDAMQLYSGNKRLFRSEVLDTAIPGMKHNLELLLQN